MACFDIKLDDRYASLQARHPCFGAEGNRGRLHLPVSPACNIKCRFCTRSFNGVEERPGVTRQILPIDEADGVVQKALELCPKLSVIGVAGPGDSLASPHALQCFRQLKGLYPELIGCMSTNGLMLPEYIEDIVHSGVESLTVTVNAVDPEILGQIVENIHMDGKTYTGTEAGKLLSFRQLWGIRKLTARNVLIKINTVLIPSINGDHIREIARVTSTLGASLINIIPLIPQGDFVSMEAPTCWELNQAREAAEEFLPVFRNCQHCRADACGVLGKQDVSAQVYENLQCGNTFSHG